MKEMFRGKPERGTAKGCACGRSAETEVSEVVGHRSPEQTEVEPQRVPA